MELGYGGGGSLTKQNRQKLTSLQRPFLLRFSRGYKTISTDALNVLTGIPPITVTLDYEFQRTRIIQLKDENLRSALFSQQTIQEKVFGWQLHPASETTHFQVNINKHSYKPSPHTTLYTDGSSTETGVAAAFCILEGSDVIHQWASRLGDNNTVFQAELFAILSALEWCLEHNTQHHLLYSDSLSSLQAIHAHRTKHPVVLEIKKKLQKLRHNIALGHVSAHIGIKGNELADSLAKDATKNNQPPFNLPLPPSYIKKTLKKQILPEWQLQWTTSTKGRHTHNLIPKVSLKMYNLTPPTTAFLTGHGPFPKYLKQFKIKRDNKCDCGAEGTPDHAYFNCHLTARWHLIKPNNPPDNWLTNILSRPLLLNKLAHIYKHLQDLSNLT